MPPSNHSQSRHSSPSLWRIVSIQDYLVLLRERWLAALAIAALISIAFCYNQLKQPKVFVATSLLQLNQRADRVVDMKEVVDQSIPNYSYLEAFVEQIQTSNFAKHIAQSLSVEGRSLILQQEATEKSAQEIDQLTKIIQRSIKAENRNNSPTIRISASSNRPEVAMLISKQATTEYIKYKLTQNSLSNSSAVGFLKEEIEALEQKIETGDRELQAYREDKNLVSLEDNQNIIVERLKSLNHALSEAKLESLAVETRVKQIEAAQAKGESMYTLRVISNYGSIPELIVKRDLLESTRKTFSEKYFEEHPKMLLNASEINAVQQQLDQNVQLAIADQKKQLAEVKAKVESIINALAEAEKSSFKLDQMGVEYDIIQRKVENQKRTFDQLVARFSEANITSRLNNTNLRVLSLSERAALLQPILQTALIQSGMLFIVLFTGIPLLLEILRNKVSSLWDIEEFLQQDYLGGLPKSRQSTETISVFEHEDETMAETFRAVYSKVSLLDEGQKNLTVLVTSTMPGEGKSFTSSNLAICAAAHGKKTIIVDCDFRRPSLSKNFDTPNDKGSLDWLRAHKSGEAQSLDLENLGIHNIRENLDLLPTGGSSRKPTELIESKAFECMLEQLKESYELVFIDASPIGLFSESLFLARHSDATIYVCLHNKVNRHKLRHFLSTLSEQGVEILGILFNQMKSSEDSKSGHAYGYGSYKEQRRYYKAYKS